jgi:glucose uptake protein GlcU
MFVADELGWPAQQASLRCIAVVKSHPISHDMQLVCFPIMMVALSPLYVCPRAVVHMSAVYFASRGLISRVVSADKRQVAG